MISKIEMLSHFFQFTFLQTQKMFPGSLERGAFLLLFLQILFHQLNARNVGRVLQLTDFHIDNDYNAENGRISAFCHLANNTTKRPYKDAPGHFGDHRCDAPKALLEYLLREARELKPDLIIWTGDNTPHVDYNLYTVAVEYISQATDLISSLIPNVPVVPAIGNHDFAPANFVPDQPNEVYVRTFEIWKKWIGDGQKDAFSKGGYYKLQLGTQTFLVLNTNLYYVYNHRTLENAEDPAEQFAFLERELREAKRAAAKVHIVGHIPPGAFEREYLRLMKPEYNERLLSLMGDYAANTNWLIFGHLHTDTFRVVKDSHNNPVQVIHVSPAVSPFKTNNPAFRVYEYDKDTHEILDIKTYFVDLDELNYSANKKEAVHMKLEYSMREAYGMDSLKPTSFSNVLTKLKNDEQMFGQYIRFNSVQSNRTMPSTEERAFQLCAIEHLDHPGYLQCVEEQKGNGAMLNGFQWNLVLLLVVVVMWSVFLTN